MNTLTLTLIFFIYAQLDLGKCLTSYAPKLVDSISVTKPGFATFIPSNITNNYHIAISSFDGVPFSNDYVFFIANYSIKGRYVNKKLDNTKLVWPNEASYTNESIISMSVDPYGGVLAPGGFLVPSKENGGIFYYPFLTNDKSQITDKQPIELTYNSQGSLKWFYHRVRRVDMNGDGQLDLLTCRSYKPIIGQTKTELVTFIFDAQTQTYTEKVILNDACDIFFDLTDIDGDGRFEIIASGFFIAKLVVIYSDDSKNSFLNGNVQVRPIDTNGGQFFDVHAIDLDLDEQSKNKELLVTNHQGNNAKVRGSLFYYKLTGDLRTGTWSRFTIYNNFPVLEKGPNQAAPGGAKAFWPKISETYVTRPYILVAGDGAEYAYLFEPNQSGSLYYTMTWSHFYQKFTVGGISIADINGDGYAEAIIAIYEANQCDVYSFVPSSSQK